MRRWLLWIAGGVFLVILCVVYLVLQDAAPFRFLEGHQPLVLPRAMRTGGLVREGDSFYEIKGDYDALRKLAFDELSASGFTSMTMSDSTGQEIAIFFEKGPLRSMQQGVTLHRDTRFDLTRFKIPDAYTEEGWVSVRLEGSPRPDFLSRLRRMLGL